MIVFKIRSTAKYDAFWLQDFWVTGQYFDMDWEDYTAYDGSTRQKSVVHKCGPVISRMLSAVELPKGFARSEILNYFNNKKPAAL